MKLNDNEKIVLESLDEIRGGSEDGMCSSFDWIGTGTKLDRKEVRRACRSLKRKGFAEFHRGLMNDDGQVAGSGYCISHDGAAFLNPCDICQGRISYDYWIDKKSGELAIESDEGSIHIRECDEHYKDSAARSRQLFIGD